MASFFAFLFSSSLLLTSLIPLTWRLTVENTRDIVRFAWSDPSMYPGWWDKRWTWIGGPNTRYVGALIYARNRLNSHPRTDGGEYALMPLFVLVGALGLTSIAIGTIRLLSYMVGLTETMSSAGLDHTL